MYAEHSALYVCAEKPETLLDELENYQYPRGMEKWLTREE
jgi:hypothetical protein